MRLTNACDVMVIPHNACDGMVQVSTTDQSIGWFLNNTNTLSNDHFQLTRYAFGNPKMHLSR